jgi:hypothetical protein
MGEKGNIIITNSLEPDLEAESLCAVFFHSAGKAMQMHIVIDWFKLRSERGRRGKSLVLSEMIGPP